jgi:hypothetical protein
MSADGRGKLAHRFSRVAELAIVGSQADNLWEMIEVLVSRVQRQVVLQNQRGQPHVVRRNRRALLPELAEHGGVVVSGLVVGKEDADAVFQQETS